MGKGGVVTYPSAGEGTWKSLFTIVPRIICKCTASEHGGRYASVIPHIFPQVILFSGLGFAAHFWNPLEELREASDGEIDDVSAAIQVIGILLSFLMVFKTQSAYAQFWQASKDIHSILQSSRHVARLTVTCCEWDGNPLLRGRVRKALRLLVLFFYVMIEYFQRTGDADDEDDANFVSVDASGLRLNVAKLTGDAKAGGSSDEGKASFSEEFSILYNIDAAEEFLRRQLASPFGSRTLSSEFTKLAEERLGKQVWERASGLDPNHIEMLVTEEKKQRWVHTVRAPNPCMVLFWLQIVLKRLSNDTRRAMEDGRTHPATQAEADACTNTQAGLAAPLEGQFYSEISRIEGLFDSMELVDKTAFPFPCKWCSSGAAVMQ